MSKAEKFIQDMSMKDENAPARGQVPDRIKDNLRWIDDAILARMKEQANWPAGAEVIIYCHDCDRETVTAEIERKGYKVVHYVSCDQDRILDYAIQKGQYVMCKKEKIIWYQNKTDARGDRSLNFYVEIYNKYL